jgi:hypothetical protein
MVVPPLEDPPIDVEEEVVRDIPPIAISRAHDCRPRSRRTGSSPGEAAWRPLYDAALRG